MLENPLDDMLFKQRMHPVQIRGINFHGTNLSWKFQFSNGGVFETDSELRQFSRIKKDARGEFHKIARIHMYLAFSESAFGQEYLVGLEMFNRDGATILSEG